MNVVRGIRAAARLGSNLVQHSKTVSPKLSGIVGKPPMGSVNFLPSAILVTVQKPRLEIIDPLAGILGEISTPSWRKIVDVSLPEVNEKNIIEPPTGTNVLEKRAARLIVIRRRKMKKHKWRKLQKKMKYFNMKKRQKKELKKEKEFQAVLLAKIKEAEKFNAEDYVTSRLKIAHWEKPITRVRGFYAPDWVIRDHLKAEEEKKRLKERIEYCLQMKK